jgi:hypothetical protein
LSRACLGKSSIEAKNSQTHDLSVPVGTLA